MVLPRGTLAGRNPPRPTRDPGLSQTISDNGSKGGSSTNAPRVLVYAQPPRPSNLYQKHVRALGRFHGIEGVDVLPDDAFDPPAPWKDTHEPITPEQAKQLYDEEYAKALEEDESRAAMDSTLSPEEKSQRTTQAAAGWKTRMALNELVLKHRTEVFFEHHQSERSKM